MTFVSSTFALKIGDSNDTTLSEYIGIIDR